MESNQAARDLERLRQAVESLLNEQRKTNALLSRAFGLVPVSPDGYAWVAVPDPGPVPDPEPA